MSSRYPRRGKPVVHRWDDALARMDPLEFERVVADYYRGQGFHVEHSGTGGAGRWYDGGIDLKLYRDDQYLVVQCKRSTVEQVTHNPVHELLGVMHTERATGAIFINSGEYSPYALRQVEGIANFQMVDGHQLRDMLGPIAEPAIDAAHSSREPEAQLSAPIGRPRPHGRVIHGKPGSSDALAAAKLVAGLMFLLVMVAWQCSRTPTSRFVQAEQRPAAPAAALPAPLASKDRVTTMPSAATIESTELAPPAPRIGSDMSDAQMREWKRRNAESMRVLKATTAEM